MAEPRTESVKWVEKVIEVVRARGWKALDTFDRYRPEAPLFRPLPADVLASLTLPQGAPLPPSLRTWLAFDAGFLAHWGWFELEPTFRWTPRSLQEIARAEYDGEPSPEMDGQPPPELDDSESSGPRDVAWSPYFAVPTMSHAFLLPGGSDTRRVYVLTSEPDAAGDYPVLYTDIDDQPLLAVLYPGLDLYLAETAGLLKPEGVDFNTVREDRRFRSRFRHHERVALAGRREVEWPAEVLAPPRAEVTDVINPFTGIPVQVFSLAREDWTQMLAKLRPSGTRTPFKGASEANLASIEARWGWALPSALRRFLAGVDGLRLGRYHFLSSAELLAEAPQRALAMRAAEQLPPPEGPRLFWAESKADGVLAYLEVQDGEVISFVADEGLVREEPCVETLEALVERARVQD
ncbi:SMI1/KNR4 family protein [Myxococcaceae bacterium JPH2]|nr:SMI1/KNR4 family protein [Myxococcaceae bacterium JPH2]